MLRQTTRTTVNRKPDRASYDRDKFNQIIDEAKFGHLAFMDKDKKTVESIPMLFWRHGNFIYFHCSVGSRLAKLAEDKSELCISFAVLNGLVLAKSAFSHSVNYRSAVIYGQCTLVDNTSEKLAAFEKFMDLFDTKRWNEIRKPNNEEMKATALFRIPIEEAVVKMRQGPPVDKEQDRSLKVWAGTVPIHHVYGEREEYDYEKLAYKKEKNLG